MVDASGLREELKDELGLDEEDKPPAEENAWEVVYGPCVAVRERPSTKARMLGIKRKGTVVGVDYALESLWVKLKGEPGFMLCHGAEMGLGVLLAPRRGHYEKGGAE